MTDLTNFYPGTTKRFSVTFTWNDTTPDISGDTVTFRLKYRLSDTDAQAAISTAADVATAGASGVAQFELTPAETNIPPGRYYWDITWVLAGGREYVIPAKAAQVTVLERVSDAG